MTDNNISQSSTKTNGFVLVLNKESNIVRVFY
jgi:hypothetical protein